MFALLKKQNTRAQQKAQKRNTNHHIDDAELINVSSATKNREYIVVNRGLYVGRFQPFHKGHLCAIQNALQGVDELIVVIGSAQYSHNSRNPFTAGERLTMIQRAFAEAKLDKEKLWIVPVPDVHLHMLWVSAVEGYTPKFNVVFSNEPLTRRLFVEAGYHVIDIPFFDRKVYISTLVREKMVQTSNWKDYVPQSIAEFIEEIDGVNRVKALALTDKIN